MVSTRPNLVPGPRFGDPDDLPDRPRGLRDRRVLIGVAVAAVLGAGFALWAATGTRDGGREERVAVAEEDAEGVRPAAADEGLSFTPAAAREPYRPVDEEAIRRAYGQVGAVYAAQGVSGLARYGIECFRTLERAPNYATLDFCLAFDAISAAVNQRLAGTTPPPPNSWFGRAAERDLQVAQAVMGPEGDASARLLDIHRLAVEVARQGGPVIQAGAPAAPPPPAAPVQTSAPVVEQPAPAPVVRRVEPSPPPARPAPIRAEPRPARAESQPARVATAARSEPPVRELRSFGPSFNCRYARTRSEKMVCGDPGLAALDRGLNSAFEEAIAKGADRRTLRAAQDRWLSRREAAASDPSAVAEEYRRRIEELRAMN